MLSTSFKCSPMRAPLRRCRGARKRPLDLPFLLVLVGASGQIMASRNRRGGCTRGVLSHCVEGPRAGAVVICKSDANCSTVFLRRKWWRNLAKRVNHRDLAGMVTMADSECHRVGAAA
jgi:hypothetical protein